MRTHILRTLRLLFKRRRSTRWAGSLLLMMLMELFLAQPEAILHLRLSRWLKTFLNLNAAKVYCEAREYVCSNGRQTDGDGMRGSAWRTGRAGKGTMCESELTSYCRNENSNVKQTEFSQV